MGQARLRGTQAQREAQAKAALEGMTPEQQRIARGRNLPAAARRARLVGAVLEGMATVLAKTYTGKRTERDAPLT